MRQHGNCDREWKREKRIGARAIVTEIVHNDCKLRGSLRVRCGRMRADGQRCDQVDRMRSRAVGEEVETSHSAARRFTKREIVALGDADQSVPDSGRLRRIAEGYVDVIGCEAACRAACGLPNLGTNRDLGLAARRLLSGVDDFRGDSANFRFARGFLAAAREEQDSCDEDYEK